MAATYLGLAVDPVAADALRLMRAARVAIREGGQDGI